MLKVSVAGSSFFELCGAHCMPTARLPLKFKHQLVCWRWCILDNTRAYAGMSRTGVAQIMCIHLLCIRKTIFHVKIQDKWLFSCWLEVQLLLKESYMVRSPRLWLHSVQGIQKNHDPNKSKNAYPLRIEVVNKCSNEAYVKSSTEAFTRKVFYGFVPNNFLHCFYKKLWEAISLLTQINSHVIEKLQKDKLSREKP